MPKTKTGTVVSWRNSAPGLAVFRLMPESGARAFPHYKAGQYIALGRNDCRLTRKVPRQRRSELRARCGRARRAEAGHGHARLLDRVGALRDRGARTPRVLRDPGARRGRHSGAAHRVDVPHGSGRRQPADVLRHDQGRVHPRAPGRRLRQRRPGGHGNGRCAVRFHAQAARTSRPATADATGSATHWCTPIAPSKSSTTG